MADASHVLLGVDGGGSKTIARVVAIDSEGLAHVLGARVATASNPLSVGWDAAETAIAAAISGAISEADARPVSLVAAIAGCGSPAARARLQHWVREQGFAEHARVVPDHEPILSDAPVGVPAVGLIAGTGSSAIARNEKGLTEQVGGWGYLIDDAGSGFALGREALQRVAALSDQHRDPEDDPLSSAILAKADVRTASELKSWLYHSDSPRATIASLAPVVVRLAEGGDRVAAGIADRGATALGRLAEHAGEWAAGAPLAHPPVFLTGGLLGEGVPYLKLVVEELEARGWPAEKIHHAPDAATACARMALQDLLVG